MAILNNSNAISSGGYDVNNSLRFRDSASAYLSRTPASAGNRKTFTWSGWVKKAKINDANGDMLFSGRTDDNNRDSFGFSPDAFQIFNVIAGAVTVNLTTTAVYRDPSSWYHMVIAVDTTQATAANRVKIYVNGNQVTSFTNSTYPAQNENFSFNNNITNYIGVYGYSTLGGYFDGYMTDINFIDGQALTPSSFGETDTTTGSWKPKAYSGTYGTNGFYLKFSDIATTSGSNAGLGKDFSGNGNYFTTNNISVTAGTTYDAMIDSPTLTSATVANYAVLNPLDHSSTGPTVSDGNLLTTSGSSGSIDYVVNSSIGATTGKFYCEVTATAGTRNAPGVTNKSAGDSTWGSNVTQYISGTGNIYKNGTLVGTYATWTTGDVIGMALDIDNQTLAYYKNNTLIATITSLGLGGSPNYFTIDTFSSSACAINFGQRPFNYTPPTGFVALNTYNLPDSTIKKGSTVMDATLYTGTGATQSITNAGAFKPDFVWMKTRNVSANSNLIDSVRGVTKLLQLNSTGAEATNTDVLSSFNSNGFTVVSDYGSNYSGNTYVGWQWQAGQGSTVSNTSGSITSNVSVNTTAGFSVVTYTGTGANATVGHGLGVAPKMVIVKVRSTTDNWYVYHVSLGNTQAVLLNGTQATSATGAWNNTTPTSSVISLGTTSAVNASSATYVAYCWAEIAGFSKAFSYTGNGSTDGSFVYTGFLPRFVLIKRTDTTGDWYMWDTARNTYDVITNTLLANSSAAETSATSIDALSNGFKLRNTTAGFNASSGTYIGMAWATNPFKNSNAF